MDLINTECYINIINYNKINIDIGNSIIAISDLKNKKIRNESILVLQENIYFNIIKTKIVLLKKYKFNIIKFILAAHKNKNDINNLNISIKKNISNIDYSLKSINSVNYELIIELQSKINTENEKFNTIVELYNKNNFAKLLNLFCSYFKKYIINSNNSDKSDNIIKFINNVINNNYIITKKDLKNNNIYFILYFYKFKYELYLNDISIDYIFNLLNIIHHYSIYKIKKNYVHDELKKTINEKNINNKLINKNKKLLTDINKIYKKNDIINKKINNFIYKYKYNEAIIENQYRKYNAIQMDFVKNIMNIDNNIELLNTDIKTQTKKINALDKILIHYNKIYADYTNIDDCCSICAEELKYCVKVKCKHYFHYSCLLSYIYNIIEKYNTADVKCPICKQDI